MKSHISASRLEACGVGKRSESKLSDKSSKVESGPSDDLPSKESESMEELDEEISNSGARK
ncbi:MAG: hypothetical protein WCJ29_04975 [bacterium]